MVIHMSDDHFFHLNCMCISSCMLVSLNLYSVKLYRVCSISYYTKINVATTLLLLKSDEILNNAGVSIFLLLIIDRIHYYIRELRTLRNTLEAGKKQDGSKNNGAAEVKALNEEIHKLKTKITKLESESGKKGNEIKST